MSKENEFINKEASAFFRETITHLAEDNYPDGFEHPYLRSGAPRWMYLKAMEIEHRESRIREKCLADYQCKNITWLYQLDGFNGKDPENSEPEYCASGGFQLANCGWNARLYIAPETSHKQAITLAQGFVERLKKMTAEDFDLEATAFGPPRVKASINESHEVQEAANLLPLKQATP